MANHTRGPRGRSRKPRPQGSRVAGGDRISDNHPIGGNHPIESSEPVESRSSRGGRQRGSEPRPRVSARTTFGERPHAPWHPLPLSELLILAGAIAFALALHRLGKGPAAGGPLLLVGIGAVALGTIEVTLREHRSGFRSHTILLALLPVVVLHSVVVLGASVFTTPPRLLNVGMLAVDLALFVFLFRLLRSRFLDARARAASRR